MRSYSPKFLTAPMPKVFIRIRREFMYGLIMLAALLFRELVEPIFDGINVVQTIPFQIVLTLVVMIVYHTHWHLYYRFYKHQ